MQFLWLERKFLTKSDDIAKKARVFREDFLKKCNPSRKLKPIQTELTGYQIMQTFKCLSVDRAMGFYMLIANDIERKVLKAFLKNQKDSVANIEIHEKSARFFNFVYHMIENQETRDDFFEFIKELLAYDVLKSFKLKQKQSVYEDFLHEIINILKKRKK
jgi:hypothetical protein